LSGAARIVVTRRIPEEALELLRGAGEVWVSPHDRPLTPAELHAAVAGADAVARNAVGFMRSRAAVSIKCRVSAVRGQWSEITSAVASSSSSERCATPSWASVVSSVRRPQ
jgi:hypothetical protein